MISSACISCLYRASLPRYSQVYAILDETFLAGEIEESSKSVILDRLDYLEKLE